MISNNFILSHIYFFQNLLQRHIRQEEEIKGYDDEIKRLNHLATLMTKAQSAHNVSLNQAVKSFGYTHD